MPLSSRSEERHYHPTVHYFLELVHGKLSILLILIALPVCLCAFAALSWGASGSLRVIDSSAEPLTLHPNRTIDPHSDVIISQMYEGLLDYDARGELVPRLATSWQEISPTRFRFWLRKGVHFHNGEPFDADAVKFSVDRMLRGHTPAAKSWLFDRDMRAEIIDQYTVDLVTSQPDARLISVLPLFLMIVPPKYLALVGDDGLERSPNGTGPYRFSERRKGEWIRLTANGDYWQNGLPRIAEVTFLFVPQKQQVDVLMRGKADLVTKLRGIDSLPVMTGPNTRVVKRQEAGYFWVTLKNHDSPFADKRVRQAVNFAVNKDHLIEFVDKGNSSRTSISSGVVEYGNSSYLQPYPFDLKKARKLLAGAGYQHGLKIRVLATEQAEEMIRAIKSQLKVVGVEMDLTIVTREELLQRIADDKAGTGSRPGGWDMMAWVTTNPTLNAFFIPVILFYSDSPYAIMHDPEFDKLYQSFVREKNPALRRNKLDKFLARTMSEAYGIFIAQRVKIYGVHWDLNIEPHPAGLLIGRTLAEAYWKEQPDSIWNERELMRKKKGRKQ